MKIARSDLAVILVLLAVILSLFPPSVFLPSRLLASASSDAITQFLPHQLFIRRSLLEDRCLPFWNPYECAGTPAFPNPLYPLFAFPHLLLHPLPPALALNAGFLLHLFLAGLLMHALARRAGCSRPASLLAALVFSIGSRGLSHVQAGLYSRMIIYALVPLPFLAAERCLARPSARSASLLALALLLAMLPLEFQFLAYLVFFIIAHALLRLRLSRPISPFRPLACVALGILVAPALGAFCLLPGLRLFPLLTRARPLGGELFSLMPGWGDARLLLNPLFAGEFGAGGALPWESAVYVGLVPLALAAALCGTRDGRRDLALWGIPAAIAVFLSLRELAPLHRILLRAFPPLGAFRNPGRMLAFTPLFLAMLSARGLDGFRRTRERGARCPRTAVALAAIGIALAVSCGGHLRRGEDELMRRSRDRARAFFGAGIAPSMDAASAGCAAHRTAVARSAAAQLAILAAAAVCALCGGRRIGRLGPAALVALSLADLRLFGGAVAEVRPLAELYPRSRLTEAAARGGGRLLDMTPPPGAAFLTALPYYDSVAARVSRADGYTPVNFEWYARFLDAAAGIRTSPLPRWSLTVPRVARPAMLSLLGTEWIISESPRLPPPYAPAAVFDDVPVFRQFIGRGVIPRLYLHRDPGMLPAAWLVPSAVRPPPGGERAALGMLDPRREAIVPRDAPPLAGGEPYRPVGMARHGPNRITMEVETGLPAYLCTGEVWAPGWTATAGGGPAPLVRVNGIFRGIRLESGRHAVRMRYRPPGLRAGLLVSCLTAAALAIACAAGRRGKSG
ncbi:MAG: YfhO family protein [bacterium]|nr:YfhO family protein [bacterium]